LLFLLYINDLTLAINVDSKLLLYADDTSGISGTSIREVQTKSIIALDNTNKWFVRNGLFLSLTKTKIMKFLSDYQNNTLFQIFLWG
jgi:hypothetical protein